MKQTLIILLALTIVLSFSSWAAAREKQEPLGEITSLKGRLEIKKKESRTWVNAAPGKEVFFGDA
ncbi:MAG: hypothetical protein ABFS43_19230, partial [Thermodesulfobacteriota bacterium]